MAGDTNILNKVIETVAVLDDAAYVTHANMGLLRRARKEMEKGVAAAIANATVDKVEITVAEHTVSMGASGLAGATCTCAASGSCWHILLACLRLAEMPRAATPSLDPPEQAIDTEAEDEWLKVSEAGLRKWAGAEAYRKACSLASNDVKCVEQTEVVFEGEIRCRLVPKGGLEGILSNAPARQRKPYAVAAVLAYRQARGLAVDAPPAKIASAERDLSILIDVQMLAENAVEVGLNHLSLSTLQRMQHLSVQCRAAGLIRPSLELESCATEIEWLLERHARAESSRLFDKLARLYALAESIRNQGPAAEDEYIGTPRAKYISGDVLGLVGVGAYPWETESGFIGITALFWSPEDKTFFSWSDSRPRHSSAGFTPLKRLDAEAPWAGGGSLRRIARAAFRLENPKVSPERRLSVHAGCRAVEVAAAPAPDLLPPALTRWSKLRESQAASRSIGLRRSVQLDALVRIQPATWHKPSFDPNEQRLVLPLEDADGEVLLLLLPFTELTAPAIHFLESYNARRKEASLLCYYRTQPAEHVFPVSLFEPGDGVAVTDLLFAPVPPKTLWQKLFTDKIRRFIPIARNDGDGTFEEVGEQGEIAQYLSPVDDFLLQRAESGLAAPGASVPNADLAALGFSRLASCLNTPDSPRALLRARYHYLLLLDSA